MDFTPPLFLFAEDLEVFTTSEQLVMAVEPWDVSEDLVVFDSLGRRIVLRSEGVVRTRRTVGGRHARTWIDEGASGERDLEAFEAALRRYVPDDDVSELEQLVLAAVARHGPGRSLDLP